MSSARERFTRVSQGYDEWATAYALKGEASPRDWFEEPQNRLRALLKPGARVLDIGCASGLEMADLRALDLDPIGLDVSQAELRLAQLRLPPAGLARGTALALPFRAGAFDGVWASASLLHLAREEAPLALAEIRRVLRAGGPFYSSVQGGGGESWVRGDAVETDLWYTFFEEQEWREMLVAAGFSIRWFFSSEAGDTQEGATGWINTLAAAE